MAFVLFLIAISHPHFKVKLGLMRVWSTEQYTDETFHRERGDTNNKPNNFLFFNINFNAI